MTMSDSVHVVCPHCDAVNRLARERLADKPVCGKCAKNLFEGQPADVDSARFNKHISRNDIPVLVDFWAPWCGPCKMMAPAYVQAAQQLEPAMRLLKLDTEQAQDLAARFNIRSIPTLALFKNGREVARQAGAMDAGSIAAWAKAQAASADRG
jgi:thioredoxin 2